MHVITRAALAGLLFITAVPPVVAADHEFTLHNNINQPLTSFTVRGGKVAGFKRIEPGKRRTFTVTMPDGECVAAVSARVSDGRRDGRANICDTSGYVLTPGPSGSKFLPLSQVMLH